VSASDQGSGITPAGWCPWGGGGYGLVVLLGWVCVWVGVFGLAVCRVRLRLTGGRWAWSSLSSSRAPPFTAPMPAGHTCTSPAFHPLLSPFPGLSTPEEKVPQWPQHPCDPCPPMQFLCSPAPPLVQVISDNILSLGHRVARRTKRAPRSRASAWPLSGGQGSDQQVAGDSVGQATQGSCSAWLPPPESRVLCMCCHACCCRCDPVR